ncbi:2-oxoglutarate/2-oxoacid ferredoxin oxidoreductase, gamma subunit / 2-oxoglutarate/2-oxoacid ferredoxin oxidoreductase, alpha subunit [hydrothermal vent metagenome]|uniref:2-oxoglutarate/2-oxoacid ferredoxin oxidoreductase, gamma subunit / 2-oxoglutarate/2-oxoacid ferredoxin oxidoreductase, alpha subunit n=1 Tax=hydrothermal vent metagenome TaxID=652676 RepID=A0A3B1BMN1_9ZZZZ
MGGAKDLIIRVGGEGGEGIISSGDMVAQAAVRSGLEVLTFKTFPAEIKGGYAMYQTRFSHDKILSEGSGFDVMCAFNQEALNVNIPLLNEGNVLIYDYPGGDIAEEQNIPGVTCYPVPMSKLAKEDIGTYRAKNMVALGAISELFAISIDSIRQIIDLKFGRKGKEVVDINNRGLDAGIAHVKNNLKKTDPYEMDPGKPSSDVMVISGNEAIGLGALLAGVEFFSAYPITPATEIANFLSRHLPKFNGTLVQAEDEIASLANVIGASYGGAKSMTATSGPGLSLMQELIGMATMMEVPVVIADVQRGGPSTGLPTKHEQSDLFLAAHGCHGDGSKVVLSPEGVEDCIYMTVEAFNIAEKYQVPVLILSDGSLGFRTNSIKVPDPSKIKTVAREKYSASGDGSLFQRYQHTGSGVSPMSIPGQTGGCYISTGLEHAESSAPKYTSDNRTAMIDKRFHKLDDLEDFFQETEADNQDGAQLGLIAWGSTIGTVREAVALAREAGYKVSALYPKLVWPLPLKALESFGSKHSKILIPEINKQAQLARIIQSETDIKPISYNIYGGMPFSPDMIVEKIKEVI